MLRLRGLSQADLPEVLRVQRSAYRPELIEPSDAFARKMALFPRGAIGCFDDDRLVAYMFCHPWTLGEVVPLGTGSLALPDMPSCLYVHDLAVEPQRRGYGLAGGLVDMAIALARSLGLPCCALTAVQGSEGFWRSRGFEERGGLEYRPGIAAVYMVRRL